jgi:hypothetical protein
LPNVASQILVAFSSIALKTGSSSPGVLEIALRTSDVAVCCASASCNSRVSRATFVSFKAVGELRLRLAFGALRRFGVAVLRRLALIG